MYSILFVAALDCNFQIKNYFLKIRCNCAQRRKNALLIQIGVEIVWDNQPMNGSWDAYLVSPTDFAGAADIITNLAKEREPGIEVRECV